MFFAFDSKPRDYCKDARAHKQPGFDQ